jgi:hypothetical protein
MPWRLCERTTKSKLVEAPPSRQFGAATWRAFLSRFAIHSPEMQRRWWAARRLRAIFWIMLLWRRRERGIDVDQQLAAQLQHARNVLRQC